MLTRASFARLGLVVVACSLLFPGTGRPATPAPFGAGTRAAFDALAVAGAAARSDDPDLVQKRYDVARGVESALATFVPGPGCRPLYDALARIAHGHVVAAEGFDRLDGALATGGERGVRSGVVAYNTALHACRGGIRGVHLRSAARSAFVTPLPEEAFFGAVRVRVPAGATALEIRYRRMAVLRQPGPATGVVVTATIPSSLAPGRGALSVSYRTSGGAVEQTQDAWLLPSSAQHTVLGEREDPALSARLATLAAGFPGIAGIHVHDLSNGRAARWNDGARFPAASTVKLGVLAAILARTPSPESSPLFYDLQALAGWSSNLAANRLLRILGDGDPTRGSSLAEAMLRRLGATRSTYPGEYRVGTSRRAIPTVPPRVSRRTTSAGDLGRILAHLHAAAAGRTNAGLSGHAARIGLALLLDSKPAGDNVGLFRRALPVGMPVAQKNGWLGSARHTAAIVYGPRGPVVVVLLTYEDALTLTTAQQLGRKVVIAALS